MWTSRILLTSSLELNCFQNFELVFSIILLSFPSYCSCSVHRQSNLFQSSSLRLSVWMLRECPQISCQEPNQLPSVPKKDPLHLGKKDRDAAMERLLDQNQDLKSGSEQGIDEYFVWPPELRPDIPHDEFDLEIPVIDVTPVLELDKLTKDLADLEEGKEGKTRRRALEEQITVREAAKANVQAKIEAACEEYGFFQIVNHGIPTHLLEQLTETCQHIFELPLEEKRKAEGGFHSTSPSKTGYGSMTRINAYTGVGNSHVWSEGFDFESPEVNDPGRLEEVVRTLWPEEPERTRLGLHLRVTSEECGKQLSDMALQLLVLMTTSLGLPKDSLQNLLGPDFQSKSLYARLRVNHYPKCAEPEKTWGIHGHTDSSVITLLHQDAVGGLQVRFKDGSWHGVRPIDGALVVNVGNPLQVWTNRRFLSAEHRVVTNKKSGRVSVAHFVIPVYDLLGPCPGLVDAEHPPRYRPFTRKEYVDKLLRLGPGNDRDQFLDNEFSVSAQTMS